MQQLKSVLYCMIKKVMVKTFNLSVRNTMKYTTLAAAIPLVLTLSACTTVDPAFKDIGTRSAPCVDGGPDTVAEVLRPAHPERWQWAAEQQSVGGIPPLPEHRLI